jgi:hypothetical protein
MVCSFCRGSPNGGVSNHNVRTCKFLKATIGIFLASNGFDSGFDTFKDQLVGWGISAAADLSGAAGAASLAQFANTCYSAFNQACKAIDSATLMTLSNREQAKFLLAKGFGWANEGTQNLILDGCGVN